jgi:hypothetical protein
MEAGMLKKLMLMNFGLMCNLSAMESPTAKSICTDPYRLHMCYRPGCMERFGSKCELAQHVKFFHKPGLIVAAKDLPMSYFREEFSGIPVVLLQTQKSATQEFGSSE